MKRLLTALIAIPSLYAIEPTQPFQFTALYNQYEGPSWAQLLGVGLNIKAKPTTNDNNLLTYKTNQWYTIGKGNPYLNSAQPVEYQSADLPYGTYKVSYRYATSQERTQGAAKYILTIDYDLVLPLRQDVGLAFLTIYGNTNMPVLTEDEYIGLIATIKHNHDATKAYSDGTIKTFGGDIFTETPLRLLLSHEYPTNTYLPPTYTLHTPNSEYVISKDTYKDILKNIKVTQRVHSADSITAVNGQGVFITQPVWQSIGNSGYKPNKWDYNSKITSFEIQVRLPYKLESVGKEWGAVKGKLEISNIKLQAR